MVDLLQHVDKWGKEGREKKVGEAAVQQSVACKGLF